MVQGLYSEKINKSTRIFLVIMGILTGVGGVFHGLAAAMLGNHPTGGMLMADIGAFTIIPNYLFTGIATIIMSIAIISWSIWFIHSKLGPTIYLFLSVILFLVGGGIAMTVGFLITWAISTRINKPLAWWNKILSANSMMFLSKIWGLVIIMAFLLLFIAMGIWLLFTSPGVVHQVGTTQYILWTFLILSLLFMILTMISGFARDIVKSDM